MPIVVSRPGEIVSLDFAGEFRRTKRGNQYAIVAIDKFTKWLEGAPTKNFDAVTSSVFLVNEWICRHEMVERILTDRGANFESKLFAHLCHLVGAEKVRTTSFHPQGNGGAERLIKSVKPSLAKFIGEDQDNWDLFFPLAVSAYNNTYHASIGMTPFDAHFGRPPTSVVDVILGNPLPAGTKYNDVNQYAVALWERSRTIHKR